MMDGPDKLNASPAISICHNPRDDHLISQVQVPSVPQYEVCTPYLTQGRVLSWS